MIKVMKRLAGCIREYITASILSPAFVAGEALLEVIIPLIMYKLIDIGIGTDNNPGSFAELVKYGTILVLLCGISLFCGVMSGKFAAIASCGFAKNVRHDMYSAFQNYSFSNIDKFSASSMVSRITTDVTRVQDAYMMLVRVAVRSPLLIIFSLAATFTISVKIGLVFLIVIPVLGIGLILIASRAHPVFERVFKTYDKLNRVVQENLRGIRVVKSYVREEHEEKKFEDVSESIFKDFSKAEKILSFNAPLMQGCIYACMLAISWIGAKMIVTSGQTEMTVGHLSTIIQFTMRILISLMMLSMVFVMIIISRASAERIVEVLEEKSDITDCDSPVMQIPDGSVRFENVEFRYGKSRGKPVLHNISLDIPSGSTVGIIGGTGSSKSSLVQLIPRLYDVTGGSVSVGGTDVRKYDIEALRNEVAMVLQKNVLFSGTINENLRWGNENATEEEIIHACRLAHADEFIEGFPDKYETHIEQGGTNVSGGQKQRLCIARALLKKPKILILDDSTSAVDTNTDAMIRRAFRDEIPDTTKFIIAQRVSSVEDADIIVVMDGGEINAVGTHSELLKTNDIYREVYNSQVKGGADDEQA